MTLWVGVLAIPLLMSLADRWLLVLKPHRLGSSWHRISMVSLAHPFALGINGTTTTIIGIVKTGESDRRRDVRMLMMLLWL